MMKKLLMTVCAVLFASSTFALGVGDYAYNYLQRLKITGDNIVTNGNFANSRDGWKDAEGNEVSAEVWDMVEGAGPNGENVLQTVAATAGVALCNSWRLEGGTYVVKYDIKGETTNAIRCSSVGGNYGVFFVNDEGSLSVGDGATIVTKEGYGYKDEWQTIVNYFTAEQGQYLCMHFEQLTTGTMITNIEIYPAVEVYDIRVLERKLAYIDQLLASGAFTEDVYSEGGTSFIEMVEMFREWVNNNDPMLESVEEVAGMMAEYDATLEAFLDANSANLIKDEKRWSAYGDTRKANDWGNWHGSGGRWFHINNGGSSMITNNGDEIGHRLQGGNSPGAACMHYTIVPNRSGKILFSLDILGHYMANTVSSWGNYVADWNRDFKGVTFYGGPDTLWTDAAVIEASQNTKIDCGVISRPYAQKFTVMIDAVEGQPLTFGISYVPDPEMTAKYGSNVNIANPQIRLMGVAQDEIDYENEIGKIIVQQNALTDRFGYIEADLAKTAADGYPWGHVQLDSVAQVYRPDYEASFQVINAEGTVLNEDLIKDFLYQVKVGTGVAYSDSLLKIVSALNSARSAYSNINKLPAVTYPQKVADALAVYDDPMYGAGDKATFMAVINATKAKLAEVMAATSDETREADEETLNAQLDILAEAIVAYKASANLVPIVDIDFANIAVANETGDPAYIITGAAGQMGFSSFELDNSVSGSTVFQQGFGAELMDVLRVGNGSGEVVIDEANLATENDIIRFEFDMFFGNLSGKSAGVDLVNAAGERVAGFFMNRYNGTVGYNDFNNADNSGLDLLPYVTGVGSSSAANAAICADNNRSSFSLIIDYKARTVQGIVVNPQKGTCTGSILPLRTVTEGSEEPFDNNIVKFVVRSDYNNSDRRCWFDNLKVFKYASQASGPIDEGVSTIVATSAKQGIFNLQGVRMNGEQLPAGLYIINGKKVVIK